MEDRGATMCCISFWKCFWCLCHVQALSCCSTCSPCSSSVVAPQLPPHVDLDTPVSILGDPEKDSTWQDNHLTREALRIIWHQRLGHMHSRRVSDMHEYAIGVPNLPIATEIDDCPISLKAKLHKANKSTSSTRKATQCNQGISIDFGFVVQSSKDSERVRRLSGLHGETCYVLLRDHFSKTLYGAALRSKAPPIEWLTKWLATKGVGPMVDSKYVRMDL
jgi:hypothetical protein